MRFFLLVLFLFLSGSAFAVPPSAPGKFLQAVSVPENNASTKCVVDPQSESARPDWPCQVLKFEQLGVSGNTNIFAAWYQRKGKSKTGIPVESEQIVLFESRANAELQPIWTDVIEVYGEKEAVTGMKLSHSPLGEFLEIKYFSGGTAGAWSEFFIRRCETWSYLQQDLDGDAAKCLPKDYGIQAKEIDLQKERVEVFAPNDNDPNCCPSGRITLKLTLVADRLVGKDCKFSKKSP